MSALRRYEIFLPRRFNDGSEVPDSLIVESILKLRGQFGAVSCETQTIQGHWRYQGAEFRDDLFRIFVDVAPTDENRSFFLELKKDLKIQFRQIDIWITTFPIETI